MDYFHSYSFHKSQNNHHLLQNDPKPYKNKKLEPEEEANHDMTQNHYSS